MKYIVILFCGLFFLSCTTNSIVSINDTNSINFHFETDASKAVSEILQSFTGVEETESIFDKKVIEDAINSSGITLLSVDSLGTTDIAIDGLVKDINNLLPTGERPFSITSTSTTQELVLTLNESTMGSFFSLMGEEAFLYMELLQAPIFTGEEMTAEEYLDFIGALYGETILQAMKDSVVTFEIQVPSSLKTANIEPSSIGTVEFMEEKAVFSLRLHTFLANPEEIIFRIQWKNNE